MSTESITPEEQLVALQTRLAELQRRLAQHEAALPVAEDAYAQSTAYSDDVAEQAEAGDAVLRVQANLRATTGAIGRIERDIADVSAVCEERRVQTLIQRANDLGAVMHERRNLLKPMLERFAREYGPAMKDARTAYREYHDAFLTALQAQRLDNSEISQRIGELGHILTSGYHHVDQALDSLVDSLARREQGPESSQDADRASELVSTDETPLWGHPEHPEEPFDIFTRPAAAPA